jgi:hypothetical protein
MVNKDQLEQTGEGKQVVALLSEHFAAEQFQPALTLIEQWYTEDQTVWNADLNKDSKLPFLKTPPAHRLLVFFASPDHVAKIKDELARREAEHPHKPVEPPVTSLIAPKPKAKSKPKGKGVSHARKARGHKAKVAKAVKKKPVKPQRSKAKPHKPKVSKAGRAKAVAAKRAKSPKQKTKSRRK